MTKKFPITGGAGFIGSNLAEALAGENEVVVVDDLSSGKRENLSGLNVAFVEGSILDLDPGGGLGRRERGRGHR